MKIKNVFCVLLLLSAIPFVDSFATDLKEHTFTFEFELNNNEIALTIFSPDTSVQLNEGDTIEVYTAGGDSIYVLFEDSIADTAFNLAWEIPYETEHMIVEFTQHNLPVEQKLLGVNVTDIFETGKANEDEMPGIYGTAPNPWDYLSEMQPKVLRFPSGAGGKFYQPLGSIRTNADDPATLGFINGGYGINIDEVIRFYDYTDETPDAPDLYDVAGDPLYTSIIEDFLPDYDCDECDDWMNEDHIKTFEDNFLKWLNQPVINPTGIVDPSDMGTDLYVNQFINLVNKIETENNYTVDVVLCLNILNETATKSVSLIEYLLDAGINVVGVELGNEVYFEWGALMAGFTDHEEVSAFVHYWDYINGYDYEVGTSGVDELDGDYAATDFDLASTIPADVLADHDYITAINIAYPDIKIGLPGENFNPCEDWDTPFIIGDPEEEQFLPGGPGEDCSECNYSQWNLDMVTKFDKTIAGETTGFKFDAIILHDYYVAGNAYAGCSTNTNWQVAASEFYFGEGTPYTSAWTYSPVDPNLGEVFDGIAGIPTDPDGNTIYAEQDGNFKDFAKDRLKIAFDIHASYLNFLDGDPGETKEIWFTEYNILPKAKGLTADEDEPFVNMVPNTFAHAVVFQNWVMWNLKSYFDTDYKPGIFTIGTVQAFLGGNSIDFMSKTLRNDQVQLDLPDPDLTCSSTDPDAANDYYVPRATYFTMQLLNTVHVLDLNYMKTFVGMYSLNNNLAPTSFVQLDEYGNPIKIYVYYTNIKQTTQRYIFDPGDLYLSIDGATSVSLSAATIFALNPYQLYSTAGRSQLYLSPINTAYFCDPALGNNPHPFEITNIYSVTSGTSCPGGISAPAGGVCVTVPATSAGYFVIAITPYYRKGELETNFKLYPNPSDEYFIIETTSTQNTIKDEFSMKIYSTYGKLVLQSTVKTGQMVNTDMLPSGMYTVVLIDANNKASTLKFSKIH